MSALLLSANRSRRGEPTSPAKWGMGRAGLRVVGALVVAASLLGTWPLGARDAFVMISGGDSPFDNNYSQYLQARAVAHFFEKHCPPESVWVFFGVGNVQGQDPVLCDVYRQVRRDGLMADTWLPGALRRNRPARRDVIFDALREEILPAVADGGTLYLFVGDHGSRPDGDDEESVITLWGMTPDDREDRGWRTESNSTLGVAALRRALKRGLGKGQVVFVMTQCHSGGFHYMAVPRAQPANPAWFTEVPDWAKRPVPDAFPRVAGFTATDEYSAAAGCDPAPDPVNWVGYERYFPEMLFGCDMFTLESIRPSRPSFAEAHAGATAVDRTMDKPYTTSEQFLERWAHLVEHHLTDSPGLTRRTERALGRYQKVLDGETPWVWNRAFRRYRSKVAAAIEGLARQLPDHGDVLLSGTFEDLNELLESHSASRGRDDADDTPLAQESRPSRRRGGNRAAREAWNETLGPAWNEAVKSGRVDDLLGPAAAFEKRLLSLETERRIFLFSNMEDRMREEVYWEGGYGNPARMDESYAKAVSQWGAQRNRAIVQWAQRSDNESWRAAADRLENRIYLPKAGEENAKGERVDARDRPIDLDTAVERTRFYRRVLAAWMFLLRVGEDDALGRLQELQALERTPLPVVFR